MAVAGQDRRAQALVRAAGGGAPVAAIEADVVAEGRRLVAAAAADGLVLRLLGGAAVTLRTGGGRQPGDLDVAVPAGRGGHAGALLRRAGYEPHVPFNALRGTERQLFLDPAHGRRLDVFVGDFRMCHRIPLRERLALEPETIPLAELVLTKLQAVPLEDKDARDALALLAAHPVGDADGETVNGARVAELCARDWGLWRTVTGNLAACRAGPAPARHVAAAADALRERIDAAPKSRGWRLRALLGERRRWYAVPEELAAGG